MLQHRLRVGPKGQVVLPKPVRDEIGARPGDEVALHTEGGRAIIEPVRSGSVVDLLLSLRPKKTKMPRKVDWDEEYYSQFR